MKIKKFAKKLDKAVVDHEVCFNEIPSDVEKAAMILDLIDARHNAGKDSSNLERLEDASNVLIAASEEFVAAMTAMESVAYA